MTCLWKVGEIIKLQNKNNIMDVDTILKEIEFSLKSIRFCKQHDLKKMKLQEEFFLKELLKNDHEKIFENEKKRLEMNKI